MSETYDIRKLGGDKIALLGLFVVSLLVARFVVGLKSTIMFSDPIPLLRTGLSASVPTGNGWQIQERWEPQGNSVVLRSIFSAGEGQSTAGVVCRYRAATGTTTPQMQFEQKARKLEGLVVEINRTVTDSLIFDWARVKGRKVPSTIFLATTILPDNRQLDIEVYESTGDADWAEQAFKGVIERVNLEDGRLRTATLTSMSEEEESLWSPNVQEQPKAGRRRYAWESARQQCSFSA